MMRMSRRDFARAAGASAGAALLNRARADENPKPPATAPPAQKPLTAPPAQKPLTAAQAEAEARVQLIVARYGTRISAADRTELLRMSGEVQGLLDKLRAFPLDWEDQPAHTFRAPRRRK